MNISEQSGRVWVSVSAVTRLSTVYAPGNIPLKLVQLKLAKPHVSTGFYRLHH